MSEEFKFFKFKIQHSVPSTLVNQFALTFLANSVVEYFVIELGVYSVFANVTADSQAYLNLAYHNYKQNPFNVQAFVDYIASQLTFTIVQVASTILNRESYISEKKSFFQKRNIGVYTAYYDLAESSLLSPVEKQFKYQFLQQYGSRSFIETQFQLTNQDYEDYLRFCQNFQKQQQQQYIPLLLPNPWAFILPLYNCQKYKQRHYWIYSKSPNKGKTVIGTILQKNFGAYPWKYTSIFQDQLTPYHRFLVLDEFNKQLDLQTLQQLCDGLYKVNIKNSKLTFSFNGYVIVLSNLHPSTMYDSAAQTLFSRFFIIDVDDFEPQSKFQYDQDIITTWTKFPDLPYMNEQVQKFPQLTQLSLAYNDQLKELYHYDYLQKEKHIYQIRSTWPYDYQSQLVQSQQTIPIQSEYTSQLIESSYYRQKTNYFKLLSPDQNRNKYQFLFYWCPLHKETINYFQTSFYQNLVEQYNQVFPQRINQVQSFVSSLEEFYSRLKDELSTDGLLELMSLTHVWLLPIPLFVFSLKLIPIIWAMRKLFVDSLPLTLVSMPQLQIPRFNSDIIVSERTLSWNLVESLFIYRLIYAGLFQKQLDLLNEQELFKQILEHFTRMKSEVVFDANESVLHLPDLDKSKVQLIQAYLLKHKVFKNNILFLQLSQFRVQFESVNTLNQKSIKIFTTQIEQFTLNFSSFFIDTQTKKQKKQVEETQVQKKIKKNDGTPVPQKVQSSESSFESSKVSVKLQKKSSKGSTPKSREQEEELSDQHQQEDIFIQEEENDQKQQQQQQLI